MGIPHNNTDTSIAAANSKRGSAVTDRRVIFDHIEKAGAVGCTCDAIEGQLSMLHQTVSARLKDLRDSGSIIDSGQRRKTRTGRDARVYILHNLKDTL